MLLPALEADLVERMQPDGRTCLVRVGRTLGAGVPNRIGRRKCRAAVLNLHVPHVIVRTPRPAAITNRDIAASALLIASRLALTAALDALERRLVLRPNLQTRTGGAMARRRGHPLNRQFFGALQPAASASAVEQNHRLPASIFIFPYQRSPGR